MSTSNDSSRIAAGAMAGLAAGALLSAAWMAIEAATGETSEVVRLGRGTLKKAGLSARRESAPATAPEQALAHGGHLALSAGVGGLYGALKPRNVGPLLGGALLGAGFFAAAYGILAPVLGLRPPMWSDARDKVLQRGFFHMLFGVLVAGLTPPIAARLENERA